MVRLKQNRLAEAESEIRRGIEFQRRLTPGNEPLFHYYLGEVLDAKGDLEGALSEYRLEMLNDPAVDPTVAAAREQVGLIEKRLHSQMPP
jgi:hypothetical protein